MATHALLLRAINVGKHRQLPMAELRDLLIDLGYADVSTYLRSGNVVLRNPAHEDGLLGQHVEQAIASRFGIDVPVIVRTRDEIAAVIARNPLADRLDDPAKVFVSFLPAPLDDARVGAVDPGDYEPDQFRVDGREIYFWCPDGLGKSTLSPQFWKRIGATSGTVRNWNSVTAIMGMLDA